MSNNETSPIDHGHQPNSAPATALSDMLPKPLPRNHVRKVAYSILLGYLLVAIFGMQSLHNWARHLPSSKFAQALSAWTEQESKRLSKWGITLPERQIEFWFNRNYADAKKPLLDPRLFDDDAMQRLANRNSINKLRFAPKVLLIGDSLMATVGPTLRNSISTELNGQATLMAKVGTGIARPDVHDWEKALRQANPRGQYDTVFIMLGANDGQSLNDHGTPVQYGTRRWVDIYRERLNNLMAETCSHAKQAYWLGLPPMRESKLHRKTELINILVRNTVSKHNCMQFISLKPALVDDDGAFTAYVRRDHQDFRVRSTDGIHFTAKGSQMVADYVMDIIKPSAAPEIADTGSRRLWSR